MFTPLAIDARYERFPWATLATLALMVAGTWFVDSAPREQAEPFLFTPTDLQPWQSLTSLYLHGSWGHLLSNGIALWVFGRFVEERLGGMRFLALLLAFAHVADWVDLLRGGTLPSLGASGAIAGLMTLTLFQAPKARLEISVGLIRGLGWHLTVWIFVGLWLLGEILGARGEDGSRIAHGAHLGGALAGCLAALLLRGAWLRGSGWHWPRDAKGGERTTAGYDRLMQGEAMWKAIYEQRVRERKRGNDA